jgi:flagellar hook-basal body complex protein FliE
MSEALLAIQAVQSAERVLPSAMGQAAAPAADPAGFSHWVTRNIESLNSQLIQAEVGVQQLAAGEATNLHDVMLRLEESRLAFQLAVQVRNRVVEAYQDVLRMQV